MISRFLQEEECLCNHLCSDLARLTRAFCPPLSVAPRSPIIVRSPSGSSSRSCPHRCNNVISEVLTDTREQWWHWNNKCYFFLKMFLQADSNNVKEISKKTELWACEHVQGNGSGDSEHIYWCISFMTSSNSQEWYSDKRNVNKDVVGILPFSTQIAFDRNVYKC